MKFLWRASGYYALFNLLNSLYQGYIALYLRAKGFSDGAVGLLLAGVPIAALVAQWLLGTRSGYSPNALLRGLYLISAVCIACVGIARGFFATLFGLMAFAAGYMTILPVSDGVILTALDARGAFARVRRTGAVAYALGALGAGYLLKGALYAHPAALAVGLVIGCACTFLLPRAGNQDARATGGFRAILRVPGVLGMLIFLAVQQACLGYFFTFFPIELTARGADTQALGWAYLIASAGEIAFWTFAKRVRAKPATIARMSAWLLAARLFVIPAAMSVAWMLPFQLLSGFAFGGITFSGARYMAARTRPEQRTAGQLLLNAISFGLARTCGNLLGACVGETHRTLGFGICGAALIASAVLYGVSLKKSAKTPC